MGIETIAPVIGAKGRVVNDVLNVVDTIATRGTSQLTSKRRSTILEEKPKVSKLDAFKHFPQPVLLIDRDMNLLEKNEQGVLAIENRWIGTTGNKLHFNCQKNDAYVRKTIERIGSAQNEDLSDRFVLRSLDMVCRSFTVSLLSPGSSELILTIQGDLNCTESKMESISRAFSLTNSETKIVKMMVVGLKPKEIAYEVGISLNTVRSHLRTLYAKMQVRSYNDALTQAIRLLV